MFARSARGLVDFLAAVICVWAAAWHTPAGAMVRTVAARLTDSRTTAQPLLSYYSGGVYRAPGEADLPAALPPGPEVAAIPPGEPLGRGVLAALVVARPEARHAFDDTARRFNRPSPQSPGDAAALVALARAELPSDDAAVLALFSGVDVAHYACGRVAAEGKQPSLEALAARLPPQSPAVEAASSALMLGTAYALAWPVAIRTRVTSPFGWREHPLLGRGQLHTGVDLSVPEGTEVHAVAEGVVRRAGEDSMNGRVVIVDHGHGVWTAYCHNSQLLVAVGQHVQAGERVSLSGNTGRSTGPHLHYQLELAHRPLDPLAFRSGKAPLEAVLPTAPKPVDGRAALGAAFERAGKAPQSALGGTDVVP